MWLSDLSPPLPSSCAFRRWRPTVSLGCLGPQAAEGCLFPASCRSLGAAMAEETRSASGASQAQHRSPPHPPWLGEETETGRPASAANTAKEEGTCSLAQKQ